MTACPGNRGISKQTIKGRGLRQMEDATAQPTGKNRLKVVNKY